MNPAPRRQKGFLAGPAMYLVIGLGVALALSWAGAGLAIWWLDRKVEAANEKATASESARAKEEQSRKGFQASAESCTASVTVLEKTAADALERYNKKAGESAGLSAAVQGHISAMLTRGRPPGMDECQAMKYELDAEIDRRAKGAKP